MADLETVRKRLEKKIISGGHTFREVSLKIGRKDSYIQQYVKYGFPKRLSEVDRKKVCQFLNMNENDLVDDELLESGLSKPELISNKNEPPVPAGDFTAIDIYSPRPETDLYKTLSGRMALKIKDFPEWCGSYAHNLQIIRVNTDSMTPTCASGSLLMCSMDVKEYQGDGIYIVKHGNYVQIKRVQKISADNYLLKADNHHYENITCSTANLEIIGKAISIITSRLL